MENPEVIPGHVRFEQLEDKLNRVAKENGEIILNVPFVTIDCRKT